MKKILLAVAFSFILITSAFGQRAIKLPQPEGLTSNVKVFIAINQRGVVIKAKALSGDARSRRAAIAAALKTKFEPSNKSHNGVLLYLKRAGVSSATQDCDVRPKDISVVASYRGNWFDYDCPLPKRQCKYVKRIKAADFIRLNMVQDDCIKVIYE